MATVVTVHGTYAHIVGPPDAPAPAELQWWQPGSACEQHLRQLVKADAGGLEFKAFTWSGDNSECERRKAGDELLAMLRQLEERNEDYCVVAHSHGGSVVAAALIESVARKAPLDGLKKWITIGTPFVALRKERFLFERLTLTRKVVLVASAMLLMMFLVYLAGQLYDGTLFGRRETQLMRLVFSATMMSLPFVFFYVVLKILDSRGFYAYRPKVIAEAEKRYADKWLALNHDDDEAVQGLKLLPRVKLRFFSRGFAVSTLTLISIIVLPLTYIVVLTSPTLMVGIADLLKDKVYEVDKYPGDATIDAARQQMRGLRRKLKEARETAEKATLDPTRAEAARRQAEALREQLSVARTEILKAHPDLPRIMRAQRFKRRFLEKDGKACEGGTLCGRGGDYGLNSALLFHIVTDELASAFVDEDTRWGPYGGFLRLWLPVLLVPAAFAAFALLVLMIIRFVADHVSAYLSRQFDAMTHNEITRSALGNDTEGEIAIGADSRPPWISLSYPFLPIELAQKISDYSNQASFQSLAKFRNAISTLAFAVNEEEGPSLITTYLTWRELIHTAYFEVAEFRKLLAYAIAQAEGFTATEPFKGETDFERAMRWHRTLRPTPGMA